MIIPKTREQALDEFKFFMEFTSENIEFLKSRGFEQRQGDGSYSADRTHIAVVPFKRWFWTQRGHSGILVDIEMVPIVTHNLKVHG